MIPECGARSPHKYLCTRSLGHGGRDHVADDGVRVLDRWRVSGGAS